MNNLSNSWAGQQQKILEKWSLLKPKMWKDYHFLGDCKNSQSQHSDFCDFIIISKYYH